MRSPSRRRRLQGIALFAVGLVLLLLGVMFSALQPSGVPVLSVLGFLVMFGGAVLAIFARGPNAGEAPNVEASGNPSSGGRSRSTLAQRMEERFRRRFEDR